MTAILPQQANVNISISLSVYLQQTNVRGSYFLLVAKQLRKVKKGLLKKKIIKMVGYHNITGICRILKIKRKTFLRPAFYISAFKHFLRKGMSQKKYQLLF